MVLILASSQEWMSWTGHGPLISAHEGHSRERLRRDAQPLLCAAAASTGWGVGVEAGGGSGNPLPERTVLIQGALAPRH